MSDLIDRQMAIGVLNGCTESKGRIKFDDAVKGIKKLPPAPTTEVETDINVGDKDTISRQAAIEAVMECYDNDELFEVYEDKLRELPPAQPTIMYIIMETLAECGIYGEEATIKLIGTLKRIGRDDLLPPCAR